MMGLNVKKTKMKAYVLSSFLCSIGGICYCMNTMSASVNQATGLEMDAIASSVIGGTLLTVWFYSHRDAELAENVSRDNWFRLILKITSSFLLATVFAYMIFAVITTGGIYRSPSEEMAFVLGSAAGAVIGYLVLEVIFGRGFKTVRGNWWICLADIVLAAGIALMAVTGLFGCRFGGIC